MAQPVTLCFLHSVGELVGSTGFVPFFFVIEALTQISPSPDPGYTWGMAAMSAMDDFPVAPPLFIKDAPKPRHLTTLKDARDYVEEAMRIGRPQPWREVSRRLKAVTNEEDAIEAIGDLRELLEDEDLLLPSGPGLKA
jgi:hypothetical protein